MCLVLRKNRWSGYSRSTPTPPWRCDGGVDHPLAAVGGPELGHRDLLVGGQALGQAPGGLPGGQADGLGVDVGVGGPLAHGLEGGDRLAELLAVLGVLGDQGDRRRGRAGLGQGQGRGAALDQPLDDGRALGHDRRAARRDRPTPRRGRVRPSGWPLLAFWRSTVTPAAPGSTTNTADAVGLDPGAARARRRRTCPTARRPSPRRGASRRRPRSATVDGAAGVPPSSTSAVVSTVSPATTPGSHRCCWASVPNSAMAGAAAARVSTHGHVGRGAPGLLGQRARSRGSRARRPRRPRAGRCRAARPRPARTRACGRSGRRRPRPPSRAGAPGSTGR